MGNGCSKSNCLVFSICKPKAIQQVELKPMNGNSETQFMLKDQPSNHSNEESSIHLNEGLEDVRQSKKSLRTVSRCSIKPGRRLSLHSSHISKELNLNTGLVSSIDPDDFISVHDLYNMLNDGGMRPYIHDPFNLLIIDSRDLNFYAPEHIITAKHHAKVMGDSNFTMRLSNYSILIVYGNEIKEDQDTKELINLRTEMQEYVAGDILVLREGFDLFQKTYPFLCTEREIETIAERKQLLCYPSMVLDNQLFQGRGDQATNEAIVDVLHLTHIVNITLEHRNAFPKKIKYLKLTLEDVSETNLFEHLKKTSEFIDAAISKGGRVLVHCNQGVSRSSTVTLAYLMKFKQWNLELSFRTLKARRSCSCPNAGFLKQLSEWEVEVFGEKITNIDSL